MTDELLRDALAISGAWSSELDLHELIETSLRDADILDVDVDVVAIGKAAREMASATHAILGVRVLRQLVIVDAGPAFSMDTDVEYVIGEHPRPRLGSLMAGDRLVEFLAASRGARGTIFLISGGASSLCVVPESPVDLDVLHELFDAVLESGADITTLNKLRASCSGIAGGAILRGVRTARSLTLIMVDNVVSGAQWVASGLTFEYAPTRDEVHDLLGEIDQRDTPLASYVLEARDARAERMRGAATTVHENLVVVEPSSVLAAVVREAQRRGYRTIELGAALHGDVQDVADLVSQQLARIPAGAGRSCVVGVGEVTVRVTGGGRGGRCQEFVWRMAAASRDLERATTVVARATDGRDFVEGIAGGWTDESTLRRAAVQGIEWSHVVVDNDSYTALRDLDQLIPGGRTGWNLCDVYLAVVGPT